VSDEYNTHYFSGGTILSHFFASKWRIRTILALVFSVLFAITSTHLALAAGSLVQISTDPYTNSTSQHQTEVEPDTFSFGSTIVSAFQVGRFEDGGGSNIGFATSTNSGHTWTHGFLPGITKIDNPANPYDRASDASVAFDAKHNVWLVSSIRRTGGDHCCTTRKTSRC